MILSLVCSFQELLGYLFVLQSLFYRVLIYWKKCNVALAQWLAPLLNDLMTSCLSIPIPEDLMPKFYSLRAVNLEETSLNMEQTAIKYRIENIFRKKNPWNRIKLQMFGIFINICAGNFGNFLYLYTSIFYFKSLTFDLDSIHQYYARLNRFHFSEDGPFSEDRFRERKDYCDNWLYAESLSFRWMVSGLNMCALTLFRKGIFTDGAAHG